MTLMNIINIFSIRYFKKVMIMGEVRAVGGHSPHTPEILNTMEAAILGLLVLSAIQQLVIYWQKKRIRDLSDRNNIDYRTEYPG